MIRCAYCDLFNSFECDRKHKNFPNDEICKDFSLDPKRLDEARLHEIQKMLIKYQDVDTFNPLGSLNLNDFKFVDLSEYTESKDKS